MHSTLNTGSHVLEKRAKKGHISGGRGLGVSPTRLLNDRTLCIGRQCGDVAAVGIVEDPPKPGFKSGLH